MGYAERLTKKRTCKGCKEILLATAKEMVEHELTCSKVREVKASLKKKELTFGTPEMLGLMANVATKGYKWKGVR